MNQFSTNQYYIFGAGSTAKACKSVLEKNDKEVVSFLTSNSSAKQIDDIPVINLSENGEEADKKIPVVIGVFNRGLNADMTFIKEYLQELKFEHVISLYDIFNEYSAEMGNMYWLTDKKYYQENLSGFLSAKSLFSEQASIEVFDSMLKFFETFDATFLPLPSPSSQYFPDGIRIWDGRNAFLDMGSFDGETIMDAYKRYGRLQIAIAYEPDPFNISLINKNVDIHQLADLLLLIPCGVWSKTQILKFSSGGGESSVIQDDGDISIQCVALDETLFGVAPGYIKMDIEGAEYEALKGAEKTIRKHRPSLAVCLYHHPSHFFEIPLLIKSWQLDYEFYIRSHGSNLMETVLYCVPNKHK